MNLTLPYPPTGNHSVKHGKFGHYATPEAKLYRTLVKSLIVQQGVAVRYAGPLRVVAEINPPDRRRRDMDNAWKTAADALTHAGVWDDDFQIADLRLIRGEPAKGGAMSVFVEEL